LFGFSDIFEQLFHVNEVYHVANEMNEMKQNPEESNQTIADLTNCTNLIGTQIVNKINEIVPAMMTEVPGNSVDEVYTQWLISQGLETGESGVVCLY
jgi:hypothetical protein